MRVAVVYVPSRGSDFLAAIAKSMARALEGAGHRADVAEARVGESLRLSGYDYVFLGTEPSSLGGKIPGRVKDYLAQAGMVTGKRSMAFVRKSGLSPSKALKRLMAAMESEGMIVNSGEVVAGPTDAAEAAREAPVERA